MGIDVFLSKTLGTIGKAFTGPDKEESRIDLSGVMQDPLKDERKSLIDRERERLNQRPTTNIGSMGPIAQSGFRAGQQGLVDVLQRRVAGQAPSAAEMQLQRGGQQALAAQMAAAASQRGAPAGLVARQLGRGVAATQQDVNQQAAILRAQEQQAAEAQLAGVLQGARGQDQNLALQQAQMDLQNRIAQGQLTAQESMQRDQIMASLLATGMRMDQAQVLANQQLAIAQAELFTGVETGRVRVGQGIIGGLAKGAAAVASGGASAGSSLANLGKAFGS